MIQRRQPKGTETGGQFAPDVNPESTVVLDQDPGAKASTHRPLTVQKIASLLQPGTVIECVENTHIPNTAGAIIKIMKSGARSFEGGVLDRGGRRNLDVMTT